MLLIWAHRKIYGSDEHHTHSESKTANFRRTSAEDIGSTVYVSVFDPTGGPAFKPKKMKSLPKWMQLLPTNFKKEREHKDRQATLEVLTPSQQLNTPTGVTTSESSDGSQSLEKGTQTSHRNASTPRGLARISGLPLSRQIPTP
jgi:hypothetical protein